MGCFEYDLAVSVDDCQEVIEVVRHTSRQSAHTLELLCLSQAGFQSEPIRNINGCRDGARPALDFQQFGRKQARPHNAVLPAKLKLTVQELTLLHEQGQALIPVRMIDPE